MTTPDPTQPNLAQTTGPHVDIVETEDAVARRAKEAYFTASQRQLIWARFRKNRTAMTAAIQTCEVRPRNDSLGKAWKVAPLGGREPAGAPPPGDEPPQRYGWPMTEPAACRSSMARTWAGRFYRHNRSGR